MRNDKEPDSDQQSSQITSHTIHLVKVLVQSGEQGSPNFLNFNFASEWQQARKSFKQGQIFKEANGKTVILLGLRHANPALSQTNRRK
jgi:hypothetical protein